MLYVAYILRSQKDGSYYIGSAQDVLARIARHNEGRSRATKGKGPWHLIYTESFETRAEAVRREQEIKGRKSRDYIEKLVRASRHS